MEWTHKLKLAEEEMTVSAEAHLVIEALRKIAEQLEKIHEDLYAISLPKDLKEKEDE